MGIIKKIFTYLFVALVILQCYSLLVMIIPNFYFYLAISVILCILIACDTIININKICIIIAVAYFVFISLLLTSGFYRNFEFILSVLVPFPLFLFYMSKRENVWCFFEAYTNVSVFIAAFSLFFWLFGSILGIIHPTGYYSSSQVGWGSINYSDYYHLYCEGQEVFALGFSGVRNIALFVEGPMFTYVMSIALFYELFFRDKTRKLIVIIVMIALVTSFSTTAFLIMIGLIYLKFYDHFKKSKVVKYLLVPIIIVMVVYMGGYIIQDKFVSNVYSASARTDDILAALACFFSDVFNGVGYQNMDAISPFRRFYRVNAGISTGLGAILAFGGLLWGVWYLVPPILAVKNSISNKNSRKYMMFVLMVFCLLIVTVVQSRVLCTILNAISWDFVTQYKVIKKQEG